MSDIKVIITGDATGLEAATKKAQAELGRTAIAAQKTDSSLAKMNSGVSALGNVTQNAATKIGSLAGSLISGGLITALTVAGVALFELGKKMFEVSEQQKRLNDVIDGAKSSYVKAVLEVDKVTDAFDKAKKGIISKESALKIYNNTIGKTIGETDDLNVAEKNLIDNAQNYIQYTLLKAAANIALSKAAEAAFEAEAERLKGTKNVTTANKAGTIRLNFAALSSLDFKNAFFTKTDEQIVSDKMQKFINLQKEFKAIYDSLTEQSKKFGFTEIEQSAKVVKAIKEKTKAQKEYRTSLLPQATGESGPISRISGATITPTIVVKPKFEIEVTPEQQQKVLDGMQKLFDAEKLEAFQKNAAEAISNTISNIASDSISMTAEAIGEAIAGNTEALPNLFQGLVQSIGGQVKELGKYLVQLGVQMIIAKKAAESISINPYAAIAAGAALQILGSVLTASFNKKANKGFATGVRNLQEGGVYNVGERGPETIYLPRGSSVRPNNEVNAYGGGNMVFIPAVSLRGSDLVIAFNRASQSMSRNG